MVWPFSQSEPMTGTLDPSLPASGVSSLPISRALRQVRIPTDNASRRNYLSLHRGAWAASACGMPLRNYN